MTIAHQLYCAGGGVKTLLRSFGLPARRCCRCMQAASCMWTTSETLTASLDYRATCMPNDTITVLGGIIKPFCAYSDCSCWPYGNASGPMPLQVGGCPSDNTALRLPHPPPPPPPPSSMPAFPSKWQGADRCKTTCAILVSSRLVSSRLVSSRLVSSRLVSSRLVSSRLVSSRLVSSRLSSRLVLSRLVSSCLVSSRLVSSRLVSSRLVSSRLVSSRLVSSRLVSSRLVSSRLVSSRLVSSRLVSSRLVSPRLVSSRLSSGCRTQVPEPPLVPEPVFVGSGSIGSCSDVNVDLTTSIGSGGRDWAVAEWAVNSSLPDKNLTDIRAFIATWNLAAQVEMASRIRMSRCLHHEDVTVILPLAAQPELVVPNTLVSTMDDDIAQLLFDDDDDAAADDAADDGGATYLRLIEPGHYYEFSVKLENFLGFAASSPPFRVSVAIGAIPNLIITAGQQYDMLVPAQLTIFAQASAALCPGDKAGTTALIYEWTCSREDAVSTSVDPRYFKIDPFGFNSTQSYSLQVGGVGNVCCCVVSGPAHDQCCMQLLSRARQTPIVGGR